MPTARSRAMPQVPAPGKTVIDHVAHFVPDRSACERALRRLGFSPTPFSLQYHRLDEREPLTPAGTGNYCVMLEQGYLECLAPVADTPVARRLTAAIDRYVGVHSIVFGTADARADHARLSREGFVPLAPIDLQRSIDTVDAPATARFTVVRTPPEVMAEGRIQYCQHHTPDVVWQPRWLEHPNGAIAITGVIMCVADLDEAAGRYARFLGLDYSASTGRRRIETDRGYVDIFDARTLNAELGLQAPVLPWIAGSVIVSKDLMQTRRALMQGGVTVREQDQARLTALGPEGLGGVFVFVAR